MPPDRKCLKKKLDDLRAQLDRLGYGAGGGQNATVIPASRLPIPDRRTTGAPPRKPSPPAPLVLGRLPTSSAAPPKTAKPAGVSVGLETAVAGQVVEREEGRFYLVRKPAAAIAGAENLAQRFADEFHEPGSPLRRELARRLPDFADYELDRLVFMDIETTGLSSSPLFLIGIMVWHEGDFDIRQYLARHYGEERAVIAQFLAEMAVRALLVTFNGKSFDYPFVRARAAATGVPMVDPRIHLDLLHLGRHFWRGRLPNCKLQTLEGFLCKREREGDIPGSEIPDAYHAYVRSGNACQIVSILEHNMLDLVTLADIMTRIPDED